MKKNLLLLLLASFMLAGCEAEFIYNPTHGGKYVPWDEEEDEPEEEEEEFITCTYQFYFSYSHSSHYDEILGRDVVTPILTLKDKPMFEPLGSIPDEVSSKEKLLLIAEDRGFHVDSTFEKFLGFSQYTVCLDEEGIWDFTKDTKQQAIISLYGVWVSE